MAVRGIALAGKMIACIYDSDDNLSRLFVFRAEDGTVTLEIGKPGKHRLEIVNGHTIELSNMDREELARYLADLQ